MSFAHNEITSTKKESIKPFIRWAGGKQNLIKQIALHLPNQPINKYFEPFLGAGSLFFHLSPNQSYLSDLNGHLVNSYLAIKHDYVKVYEDLQRFKAKLNKDFYYSIRTDYNQNLHNFDHYQAVRFIFLIHTSFNGIFRVNRKGEYNVPVGKLNPALPSLRHLKEVSYRLQDSYLANHSYEDILPLISDGDFIYLDPPYPPISNTASFQHYTIDKFPHQEQIKVAHFAEKIANTGAKVLVSNASLDSIKELYKNWNIFELNTTRYVSCKSERLKVKELIIRNY